MNNDFNNQQQGSQQQTDQQQNGQQQSNQQQYGQQQYYNGYGYYGDPYHQSGAYYPPQNGPYYGNYVDPRIQEARTKATNAQTYGIIALIGLFTVGILSIIFGILSINSAKKSRMMLGYELPEAKIGRILGMISLIVSIALAVIVFFLVIIYIFVILAAFASF